MLRMIRASSVLFCCLFHGASLAQDAGPFLPGEYSIGFQEFFPQDAARNDRSVRTLVWYPAEAGLTEGEPARYARPFGWTQESPYIGAFADAPVAKAAPFPLVVLSHGDGGVPQNFELLGEFLASHGYVVAAPQHSGNSAGTPFQPGMGSHRPADMSFVIDTMLGRSAAPGDLFSNVIHVDAIGVGGFSRGAATATATVAGFRAAQTGEFDTPPDDRVKALVLLDGTPDTIDRLAPDLRESVTLPTLSIAGGAYSSSGNSGTLFAAIPFYGVDANSATHGEFVGGGSCHFHNSLLEDGAPQNVLDLFGITEPVACGPDILPAGEVPEIVARHATAFLDSQFGSDTTSEGVLTAGRENLAGTAILRARVLGAGETSEWPDLILTDPMGRQVGIDPQTGEAFSDFLAREIRYFSSQSMRGFTMIADELLPGEYVLAGVGNASLTEPRDFQVTLELTEERQFSRVYERELLLAGQIAAGGTLGPLTFEIIPTHELAGDYDASGLIEQADLDVVLLNWGSELADPSAAGWLNDLPSGPVDQGELDKVLLGWGSAAGDAASAAVPEPSSLLLIGLAVTCVFAILTGPKTSSRNAVGMDTSSWGLGQCAPS
jgi:dienelactone hydrolase